MTDDNLDAASLQLETQLRRLATITDPASRGVAQDLIASVLQFHTAALERMLQLIDEKDGDRRAILAGFDQDPLIRALLVLHDLHPDSLDTRVARALRDLQPSLEKRGAKAELLSIDDGLVRVRITTQSDGRPLGPVVERAIRAVAPDVEEVVIEEPAAKPSSGFVPLESLQPAAPAEASASASENIEVRESHA